MAGDFLSLDAQEQGDILRTVADRSGRPAVILQKHIWVCWARQAVFSIPHHHPMAFKGGTSLAKVYGIIDRFSEDVDITLDYRAFEDDFDPFDPAASKTRTRRFSDRLKGHVQRYTREVMAPALSAAADRLATAGRRDVGGAALSDRALLKDVVRHKTVFFNASYANYDQCLDGRLRLVPDHDQLPDLRSDYDAMRAARVVGSEAPEFAVLIEQIRSVESDANRR